MSDTPTKPKRKRVNVRRPDVMELVQAEVDAHYRSEVVDKLKERGSQLTVGNTTVRLAQKFGFCYGVERAIDLAYASRRVFPDNNIYLIGEIIHNPEVNSQLEQMGIVSLPWKELTDDYDRLTEDDVVIVPAFGAPVSYVEKIQEQGAQIVDTTCGDVMKVWRRVKTYAKEGITSIIHGKAGHEETRATASHALGPNKDGQYLVVLTLKDVGVLTDYLVKGGCKDEFMAYFEGKTSKGFDPEIHLTKVGVANQTTMLKSETEEIQKLVAVAIQQRDDNTSNYTVFDTICGATQERQDALFGMLKRRMDMLLVVGGYNSSNTTHLVEIGEQELPSFFIKSAECLESLETIVHYDIHQKEEVEGSYGNILNKEEPIVIGVTAGASCPNNLIEETIIRAFELRGVSKEQIMAV